MEETVLSVLVTLLGGLNIYQFVFPRITKKRLRAEANQADSEAKKSGADAYDALMTQFFKLQEGFTTLAEDARTKSVQISELMGQAAFYKQLRCYRADCSKRICEGQMPGEQTDDSDTDKENEHESD